MPQPAQPSPSADHADTAGPTAPARISLERLLKRVLQIDIERCPRCSGRLKIIAPSDEAQDRHRGSQAGVDPKASASAHGSAPATCRHGAPLEASVLMGVPVKLAMSGANINASIIMVD